MRNPICGLRQRAYDAQGGRCFYCQFPMWISDPQRFARRWGVPLSAVQCLRCTAEHLVPVSQCGRDVPGNIVAACSFCNQTRHRSRKVRSPAPYAEYVGRRVLAGRWHSLARLNPLMCQCTGDKISRRADY